MSPSNYIKYIPLCLLISLIVGCERPPLESETKNPLVVISPSPGVKTQPVDLDQPVNNNSQLIENSTGENQDKSLISKSDLDDIYKRLSLTLSVAGGGFIVLTGLFAWSMSRLVMLEKRLEASNSSNNQTQLTNIQNYVESEFTQIKKWYDNLETKVDNLQQASQNQNLQTYTTRNNQPFTSPSSINTGINPQTPPTRNITHTHPPSSNLETEIIKLYNHGTRSLSANVITVAETSYTVEQRRMGRKIAPVLEENQQGNYWVIQKGSHEYLVPKGNIKINQYNYDTISSCFECLAYHPNHSSNFTLLKLATLSSSGQNWQLVEPGKLQF